MSEPIPVRVTRYRCPHCPRTASSKVRSREHAARCWRNPDAKGCKTCAHFHNDTYYGDVCDMGVNLSGNPPCSRCDGDGFVAFGSGPCPDCAGEPVGRPGPIIGCDKWVSR